MSIRNAKYFRQDKLKQIKIVDPDTLESLPPNHEGMVLATGANVMKGYLDDPEKTASVIKDGWYITGDMGKINFESYVTLTGRLSRFAKIGGEMVPLERLEDELHEVLQCSPFSQARFVNT